MVAVLEYLPTMAEEYIRSETNLGTSKESIQVIISPFLPPTLPPDQYKDGVARGIYASPQQIAGSVWVDFCTDPPKGRVTATIVRPLDEGLASRDELVQKIIESIRPYGIKVLGKGL